MTRIVIIGGGVGGLAVAARLAAAGHRVDLFERSDVVGGRLGEWERDGFRFDTGPSLLTLPQVFAELFAATGSALARQVELVRLDPAVRHVFADGSVIDTPDSPQWRRLMARAARMWDLSWRHILTSAVTPGRLARLAANPVDLATIAPGRTLAGLARSYLDDPRERMILNRYATYTGSDPRRAPAALAAIAYAQEHFGGWYVRGGLYRLAEALARRCARLGVRLHLSTPVSRILVDGGRVSGVEVGGTRADADIVVANVDAQQVYRDLLPTPGRLARLRERSLGGLVLLLGVQGTTPGLAQHTVFFPASYGDEFPAIARGRLAEDPAIYVSVSPDAAPPGHEAWFVLVNAPASGAGAAVTRAYADQVLARLAERGLEVRDRVLFRETAWTGAIYGTPSHGLRGLLRPPNRGPVPGLYLVGGSTHPGGGLPLVALSAKIVADQIGPAR